MGKTIIAIGVVVVVLVGSFFLFSYLPKQNKGTGTTPGTPIVGNEATPETQPVPADKAITEAAVTMYQQGQASYDAGDTEQARQTLETVAGKYPNTWAAKRSYLTLGDIYKGMGEDGKAVDAYSRGLGALKDGSPELAAYQAEIYNLRMKLGETAPMEEDAEYVVQGNDTLSSVAKNLMTKVELIKLVNNKLDNEIRAGQTLHISRVMPEITVDQKAYELVLSWKGHVVSKYKVGIGKDGSTPSGEFTIENKIINPDWYRTANGPKIPYGSPENILGTRWMGLGKGGKAEHTGYGIHGTTQPETVPGPTSAGCIRMLNKDVEELYEWVPMGTKVTIR